MPILPAERLQQLTVQIFERAGAPAAHAQAVAEHLVESNLGGHDSHGVLRIPQYFDLIEAGLLKPAGSMQLVNETTAGAVVDGQGGFGQVIANDAMRLAIKIAHSRGISAVAARNLRHTGRIGAYAQMAAAEGLVGITMVNSGGAGQLVAPFGGIERRLSTNPISIAVPSDGPYPLVFDAASSVAPEGKVRARHQAGKPLPEGWIINAAGQPSLDSSDFYERAGSILPLGGPAGHKGFGLALMIDILAGALGGAGCAHADPRDGGDGFLAIAIDVQQFTPLADFEQRVATLVDYVQGCPKAEGVEHIYMPGEVEARNRERLLRDGIRIEPGTWTLIEGVCQRLEVDLSNVA